MFSSLWGSLPLPLPTPLGHHRELSSALCSSFLSAILHMASQMAPVVKNFPAKAGDTSLISGLGRSPGVGNGNPLQYSCMGNSLDRGAWWATVYGVTKKQIWLSMHTCTYVNVTLSVLWFLFIIIMGILFASLLCSISYFTNPMFLSLSFLTSSFWWHISCSSLLEKRYGK